MPGALVFLFENKEERNFSESSKKIRKINSLKHILSILHRASVSPIVVLSDNPALWERPFLRNDLFFICPDYNEVFSFKHVQKAFHILEIYCERIFVCDVDCPPFSISLPKKLLQAEGEFIIPLYKDGPTFPLLANLRKLNSLCQGESKALPKLFLDKLVSIGRCIPTADEDFLPETKYCGSAQNSVNLCKTDCFYPVSKLMISGDYIFLGPGIYQLLLAIEKYNSLKYASELTGLSYSKCRRIIKRLETESAIKVLKSKKGGSEGGYTALTSEGKILLKNYALYTEKCNEAIKKIFAQFLDNLKEDLDEYGKGKS